MKSHTGVIMTMGGGAIISSSRKQKLNTRSSTEAELIAADDALTDIMWTKEFLRAQNYGVKKTVLFQDNKSAMLLETNGKESSGRRTRHINIRYFGIQDYVERKEFELEYCPTDDMLADYPSKPLQGEKFQKFRKVIMNL